MESQFYQINMLKLFMKWKLHLLVVVVVTAILAAFFSSPIFIKPRFKSYAVVYPSNIAPYSEESETEQMLQIMQSKDIMDSIIKKFDLASHYEIDSSYKYFYSTISYIYSQNVKISKTPYEGVNIEVYDTDPLIAYKIVNSIIEMYNEKVRTLHEEKFLEVVRLFERALERKQGHIDSLINRLYALSTEYGLLDYDVQAEEISRGFLRTIDGDGALRINTPEVMKLKKNIEEYGGELVLLVNLIENEAGMLASLQNEYELAYMNYDRRFTYTNMITKPYVADKKSYPVRWLIVVISVLSTFFLALVVILIIENYKRMADRK